MAKIRLFFYNKSMKKWKDWQWYAAYALLFIPFCLLVLSFFER